MVLKTNWLSSYCFSDSSSAVSHLLAWLPKKQIKRQVPSNITEIKSKGQNTVKVWAGDRETMLLHLLPVSKTELWRRLDGSQLLTACTLLGKYRGCQELSRWQSTYRWEWNTWQAWLFAIVKCIVKKDKRRQIILFGLSISKCVSRSGYYK